MEEEQYCLKWNNHQSTLLTVLTGLMDTERLADCILSAEGKMLKAHQVIISACSPYLEKLLNESRQPGYMPILIFSDLVFDELVAMKEYMYKGEVNIRQDALDSFLKAACNLQIKGLADGGGGGDEGGGGGGGKRKAPPEIVDSSPARAGRRRRRESRESDHTQDMIPQEPQLPQPVPAKKQNVFTAKVEPFEPAPVVKMEPIMDQPPMPQPQIQHAPQLVMKPEPQDHHEPETHDLTGLDDDEDYDYDMPGTSQPDLSQDISNWQMDNSMHSAEDFAASQSMNTSQPGQSSQDGEVTPVKGAKGKKKSGAKSGGNSNSKAVTKNNRVKAGAYVLVEFHGGRKYNNRYRYAAICQGNIDEDREIQVISLKTRSPDNVIFKLDDNDISYVRFDQILEILPEPSLVMQGNRVLYKFPRKINVLENA